MENSLVLPLILSCCLLLASLSQDFIRYLLSRRFLTASIESQLKKLKNELALLNNSINVLQELSARYFITLNENGFQEICKIKDVLMFCVEHCAYLLRKKDYESAKQIVRYLYVAKGEGRIPTCLWAAIGESASCTSNWGSRTNDLLSQITERLEKNSSGLKEVCGTSARNRKSTGLMINEVRLALVCMR